MDSKKKVELRIRNVAASTSRAIDVYAAAKGTSRAEAIDQLIKIALATINGNNKDSV